MKKIFVLLLSLPLFIEFTGAYNCGTVSSRFDSFQTKRDKHEYEGKALKARGNNLNSQYERGVRLNDVEVWQEVTDELRNELNKLKDEISWCESQREEIKEYLEKAGQYEEKFGSAKNFDEFDESDLDNAIKYYNKAYNLMKGDSGLSFGMENDIKKRIDDLNSMKDTYKSLKTTVENSTKTTTNNTTNNTIATEKNTTNNTTSNTKKTNYVTKDSELKDAIQWMYDNGLTMYNQVQDFLPNNEITREQASKFFVEFAAKVLGKDRGNIYNYNIFSDISKADPTLKDHIIYANNMGLFKGSNGKFNPFNKLTKAQAIAVTIRMANGYMDENFNPRYLNYYYTADSYGILKWGGFEYDTLDKQNISRGDMALILYNLYLYLNK